MSVRLFIVNMSGLGVGPAPDAKAFGDAGANTVSSVLRHAFNAHPDNPVAPLKTLARFGLGELVSEAGGVEVPVALRHGGALTAAFGYVLPDDNSGIETFARLGLDHPKQPESIGRTRDLVLNRMADPHAPGLWVDLALGGAVSRWRRDMLALDELLCLADAARASNDVLIAVSDHARDPAWRDGGKTRECLPVLITGAQIEPGPLDSLSGFSALAECLHEWVENGSVEPPTRLSRQLFRYSA